MKQVVQAVSGGPVRVEDVPRPVIGPTEVLVHTRATLISAGTERAVTQLAQSSLLAKARARPDLVRQVIRKARTEGVASTARAVRSRLGEDLPLGYSGAGIAVEVGEAVAGVVPGQLVATGGAGKANHAEWQAVPGLLCTAVPDGVTAEQAAFATVGSIALHGLRLAELQAGSSVCVIGLGLVGQLAARLALASGCRVIGLDVADFPITRAASAGVHALRDEGDATTAAVLSWARGMGVDAVIVTAADKSSSVIARVPALCRDRASVVVVGDVGLAMDRTPLYDKELSLRVARSYGPGRYETSYEEWGVDYPPGHVRWTEGRNQQAVLDLLASGRLVVDDLVTHRFAIDDAVKAYDLVESRADPYLGIVLTYSEAAREDAAIELRPRARATGTPGVGLVGAGTFASGVLVPALQDAGFTRLVAVASASGLSAKRVGDRAGFERVVSADAVIEDPDVEVVVIATPHATHASLAAAALRAGKHVWCEKPLALSDDELDDVEAAWRSSGGVLFVGFNRSSAPVLRDALARLGTDGPPLVIDYRVHAGRVPERHWYHDRREGGRLLGEVCHFVDACATVAGPIVAAHAYGGGEREPLLSDSFVVALRHAGGSVSNITYAADGHAGTAKERIEILGRGHTIVIDDFRSITVDGKTERSGAQDKGHKALAAEFFAAVRNGDPHERGLASSRALLAAAASLRG